MLTEYLAYSVNVQGRKRIAQGSSTGPSWAPRPPQAPISQHTRIRYLSSWLLNVLFRCAESWGRSRMGNVDCLGVLEGGVEKHWTNVTVRRVEGLQCASPTLGQQKALDQSSNRKCTMKNNPRGENAGSLKCCFLL